MKHKNNYLTGKMSKGTTNSQIQSSIKNINDQDLKDNFVGVFPANYMNRFINYKTMISEEKTNNPSNTDSSEKGGMHWWSILDIELQTDLLFFDTFEVDGLKCFIIQDDGKVIEKIRRKPYPRPKHCNLRYFSNMFLRKFA